MPPFVSVIIPCYNERPTIRNLLEAVSAQTYPHPRMEVMIADGLSTDGTRDEIAKFVTSHPDLTVQVLDNPRRIIPSALNIALKNARGEVFLRLDGHSQPYPDYVQRCVEDLEMNLGDNVGGIWEIRPGSPTWIAASISAAASHPLGVGDAYYRFAVRPGLVDTVPFGAFRRELLATVGFFNENLLTNEDYEFNARIRKAGGKVWLDPAIRSIYFARTTLRGLGRQYARYGFWKWRMLHLFPHTLRWRQLLPPLFVTSLVLFAILAVFFPLFRIFLGLEILVYWLILTMAGLLDSLVRKRISLAVGLPLAISVMHISWGAGFLWSMIKGSKAA